MSDTKEDTIAKSKRHAIGTDIGKDYTILSGDFEWLLSIVAFKTDLAIKESVEPKMLATDDKGNLAMIHEDQIDGVYKSICESVGSTMSKRYTDYIVAKYFGGYDEFVRYYSELVIQRLYGYVIERNKANQKKTYIEFQRKELNKLNAVQSATGRK